MLMEIQAKLHLSPYLNHAALARYLQENNVWSKVISTSKRTRLP
jgi:hypothetical protein